MNRFSNEKKQIFYHFDLYRLNRLEDFQEAGFDEYRYQTDSWTLIEWPEMVPLFLTHKVCHIKLDYGSESARSIELDTKKRGA